MSENMMMVCIFAPKELEQYDPDEVMDWLGQKGAQDAFYARMKFLATAHDLSITLYAEDCVIMEGANKAMQALAKQIGTQHEYRIDPKYKMMAGVEEHEQERQRMRPPRVFH